MLERRDIPFFFVLVVIALLLLLVVVGNAWLNGKEAAVSAIAALVSAFSTGVIALYTYTLYRATLGMESATRATIQQMQEAESRAVRAYMLVDRVERLAPEPSHPFGHTKFSVRNFGQTPAIDVAVSAGLAIGGIPLTGKLPERERDPNWSRAVIGPDSHMELAFYPDQPLSQAESEAIRQGRRAVYLFGEITYSDVLGKKRVTRFRLQCTGEDFGPGKFGPCAEGNEMT